MLLLHLRLVLHDSELFIDASLSLARCLPLIFLGLIYVNGRYRKVTDASILGKGGLAAPAFSYVVVLADLDKLVLVVFVGRHRLQAVMIVQICSV